MLAHAFLGVRARRRRSPKTHFRGDGVGRVGPGQGWGGRVARVLSDELVCVSMSLHLSLSVPVSLGVCVSVSSYEPIVVVPYNNKAGALLVQGCLALWECRWMALSRPLAN